MANPYSYGLSGNNVDWSQIGRPQQAELPQASMYGEELPASEYGEGRDSYSSGPSASQQDTGKYTGNRGYVDLGVGGRLAMSALGALPGPLGMIASAANMGIRANNIGVVDDVRNALGMGQLSFGQKVGAMLGLNDYAKTGYAGELGIGNRNYGVTATENIGMIGDRVGLTPSEAQARQAHANMASRGMYGGMSAGPRSLGSAEPGFNTGSIGDFGRDPSNIGNDATQSGTGSQAQGGGYSNDPDRDSSMYAEGGRVRDYELLELIRSGGDRPSDVAPRDWHRLRQEFELAYPMSNGGAEPGGYVIPAYVPSALGRGSSQAGAQKLAQTLGGGHLIRGDGDGRSDDVSMGHIRVSDGEFYVPKETVDQNGGPEVLRRLVLQTRRNYIKSLGNYGEPKE